MPNTATGTSVPTSIAQAEPLVTVSHDRVVTTSQAVAECFGKRHDDVLKSVRNLVSQLTADRLRNFAETVIERPNPSGGAPIKTPAYEITRDGFTLLAMGFTGKRALQFKLAYIDAFNKLEAQLQANTAPQYSLDAATHNALLLKRIDIRAWQLARSAYEWYRDEMLADGQISSGQVQPENWTPHQNEIQSLSTLAEHVRALEAQQLILQAGYENVNTEARRLASQVGVDWDQYLREHRHATRRG